MPELPEVEVTKRGVANVLLGHEIVDVYIGSQPLRQPLSPDLLKLKGAKVTNIARRGKYIVLSTTQGSLIIHLGMTGHLQIIATSEPRVKHDHFELMLDSAMSVRYNDTRRFGLLLYVPAGEDPYQQKVLSVLGPEPLEADFTPEVLLSRLKKRSCSIKQTLMNSHVVVGVGNIYASEVLFLSHIHPERLARDITPEEATVLVRNIKEVLTASIASGGTTIRDFEGADGKPGYFVQNLNVYGKAGEPCPVCGTAIEHIVQGGRSTYFCPHCQPRFAPTQSEGDPAQSQPKTKAKTK